MIFIEENLIFFLKKEKKYRKQMMNVYFYSTCHLTYNYHFDVYFAPKMHINATVDATVSEETH